MKSQPREKVNRRVKEGARDRARGGERERERIKKNAWSQREAEKKMWSTAGSVVSKVAS